MFAAHLRLVQTEAKDTLQDFSTKMRQKCCLETSSLLQRCPFSKFCKVSHVSSSFDLKRFQVGENDRLTISASRGALIPKSSTKIVLLYYIFSRSL